MLNLQTYWVTEMPSIKSCSAPRFEQGLLPVKFRSVQNCRVFYHQYPPPMFPGFSAPSGTWLAKLGKLGSALLLYVQ